MLDLDRLRINVTNGRYVVDPHAVADALLSHAGIASTHPGPASAQAEPVSAVDARSRTEPAARRPRD
jgi:hypothetical protein